MAQTDVGSATTTDMSTAVDDYSVGAQQTDGATGQKEKEYMNTSWSKQLGYFNTIPELNRAISALAIWTAGKGFTTDNETQVILDSIRGRGDETFIEIMVNMLKVKKFGRDAYAEVIKNEETGTLINLKILDTGSIKTLVNSNGEIIRFEQVNKISGKRIGNPFKPEEIFHLCNDRIADNIGGTSVIDYCESVILARNEMMADRRKVLHRNVVPVRIIEVDHDNTAKLTALKKQYEDVIAKGEVIVIPKGTVQIIDSNPVIVDSLQDIRYLENFFYQAVGIPRVIATSEDYTEASSKVGFLTFEPIYTNEQTQLEGDLWQQLAIKIKFNRPPSLGGDLKRDEAKDSGQMGFQPNDTQAGAGE